jgi:hypothetical protein
VDWLYLVWTLDLHLGVRLSDVMRTRSRYMMQCGCSVLVVLHLLLQQICPNSIKIAGSLNIVGDERRVA